MPAGHRLRRGRARPAAPRGDRACRSRHRCGAGSSSSPRSSSCCERAGRQFEYRTKDTARLAGVDPHLVAVADTGRDRRRGRRRADPERAVGPRAAVARASTPRRWPTSAATPRSASTTCARCCRSCCTTSCSRTCSRRAFDDPEREPLRTDRISWLRDLFDTACRQYDAQDLDRDDPVGDLLAELDRGLEGLDAATVRARLARIEQLWTAGSAPPSCTATCTRTPSRSSTPTSGTPPT